MSVLRSSRRLQLALALSLLLITILAISPAPGQAQFARCPSEFYYYSDWSFTELVGYEVWDCNCNHYSWGEHTPYREIYPLYC